MYDNKLSLMLDFVKPDESVLLLYAPCQNPLLANNRQLSAMPTNM